MQPPLSISKYLPQAAMFVFDAVMISYSNYSGCVKNTQINMIVVIGEYQIRTGEKQSKLKGGLAQHICQSQ